MFKITEANLEDITELSKLINNAYRGDESRKGWTTEADLLDGLRIDERTLQEYLSDKSASILKCIDEDNNIVGGVYLRSEISRLYMGMLTVSPYLQNNGIGKKLISASEVKAREGGYRSIVITVITKRRELIDWYKRHGYKETGEVRPFPKSERFGKPKVPLEFFVMEKVL